MEGPDLGSGNPVPGFNANSHKLKRFVRHMIYASKKLDKLNGARDDLSKKLDEMRKLPVRTTRNDMNDHLDELMAKVNFLVESEKKIISGAPHAITKSESEFVERINSLQDEISVLKKENEQISSLVATIKALQAKIDSYESRKDERENRIEELENKIRERVDRSGSEIDAIEEKLRMLSEKYDELVASGRHSEEDLAAIRQRIDDLRSLLESKKSLQ